MTNAPLVVDDVVLTGISGGEFGVRGRITAFNMADGKELWRTYSTGPDKDVGITDNTLKSPYPSAQGKDLGVSTWQGDEWQRGGGTTWGWYSYDPALNLFYHGSGNPGTWNPDQRPGDNKWSMSLWAQNPKTGEVRWVYQMTPHDAWDYDGVNENVLVRSWQPEAARALRSQRLRLYARSYHGQVIVRQAVWSDELGQEHRHDDGSSGRGSHQAHDRQGQHRGHLPGRHWLQGSAAVGLLAADWTVLRADQHRGMK